MEHRWSGHLKTTNSILGNYKEICDFLQNVSQDENLRDGDIIIEASGLLQVISSIKFVFCARLVQMILEIIAPADRQLQSRDCDLGTGLQVIYIVINEIENLRNKERFDLCYNEAKSKYMGTHGIPKC